MLKKSGLIRLFNILEIFNMVIYLIKNEVKQEYCVIIYNCINFYV